MAVKLAKGGVMSLSLTQMSFKLFRDNVAKCLDNLQSFSGFGSRQADKSGYVAARPKTNNLNGLKLQMNVENFTLK